MSRNCTTPAKKFQELRPRGQKSGRAQKKGGGGHHICFAWDTQGSYYYGPSLSWNNCRKLSFQLYEKLGSFMVELNLWSCGNDESGYVVRCIVLLLTLRKSYNMTVQSCALWMAGQLLSKTVLIVIGELAGSKGCRRSIETPYAHNFDLNGTQVHTGGTAILTWFQNSSFLLGLFDSLTLYAYQ